MTEPRFRVYTTPPGIALGPLSEIEDGKARNFTIELEAGRFHGFVVRRGERVFGHVDRCPHAGVPLAFKQDDYLTPDGKLIACNWHGALFRIEDGKCLGGPCKGQSLDPWPVEVRGGELVTG